MASFWDYFQFPGDAWGDTASKKKKDTQLAYPTPSMPSPSLEAQQAQGNYADMDSTLIPSLKVSGARGLKALGQTLRTSGMLSEPVDRNEGTFKPPDIGKGQFAQDLMERGSKWATKGAELEAEYLPQAPKAEPWGGWKSAFDPAYLNTTVAQNIGPTVALTIPSMALAAGTTAATAGIGGGPAAAGIGSVLTSASGVGMEASLEAGRAYDDVLSSGGSQEDAVAMARQVKDINTAMLGVTEYPQLLLMFTKLPPALKKYVSNALLVRINTTQTETQGVR